jgi:hemolysin III
VSQRVDRPQTLGEEIANSVSHGVGLIGVVAMAPFLMGAALEEGTAAAPIGAGVFVVTAGLLYLASTLYHSLAATRARRVLRVLDHSAIFLLIAGTYTPFTLGVLRGGWGWTLLGLVWSLAAGGIVLKATAGVRHPALSTGLYVGMGWLALIAFRPLWLAVPAEGLTWLLAGGVAYTAGVVFFAADDRVRYSHFVWHLFVLAGTACHAVAVLRYAR